MLRELHLSGLGVIDDVELELDPGLNVLTGETGAGKTMVTVGLALALGRRASASLVRRGAKAARVQARFDPAPQALGAWDVDGELVLARSVGADGRSTARIGAELAPVSALARLAPVLVEVHGQHEGIALLSPTAQLAFVDRAAGAEHVATVELLAEEYARWRDAERRLDDLRGRERDRERELDLLRYQVGEIVSVDPRPGELDTLGVEERRLANAERLLELATAAERAVSDDGGALDAASTTAASLRNAAEVDAHAVAIADEAASLAAGLAELARDVRTYRERLEVDPDRLAAIEERIGAVRTLLRKYGDSEDAVLGYLDEARERLSALEGAEATIADVETEAEVASRGVEELAGVVTAARETAAPRLAAAVAADLRELGMPDATIEIALAPQPDVGAAGRERVEFRFSAGSERSALPLAKVASGGELSRVMLACRSVLADLDDVATLVFDEVDAGIGGTAGVAVGRRLATLAATRQVLVVTHLPQIASFADRHFRVEKRDGTARVTILDDAGRVDELTRMLSGLPKTEAAATHAEELLAEAGRVKTAR